MATQAWAILWMLGTTLLGSFGPILMKKAVDRMDFSKILSLSAIVKTALTNKYLWGGALCYTIAVLAIIPALRGGELSVLFPLVATGYIWVSVWSVFLLKEKMNLFKWIGIILIVAGATLIGMTA